MLALDQGRYRPAEVQTGREAGDETQILAGLSEGEKVVASGQFLLDPKPACPACRRARSPQPCRL
jgi:Cu(I)/Ag(I) efflux system membrane fusion protein